MEKRGRVSERLPERWGVRRVWNRAGLSQIGPHCVYRSFRNGSVGRDLTFSPPRRIIAPGTKDRKNRQPGPGILLTGQSTVMKHVYPRVLTIALSCLAVAAILTPTGVIAHGGDVKGKAVHPNPFTEGTTFELTMPQAARIRIDVYNIRGQHIKNLYGGDGGEIHPSTDGKPVPIDWDGKDKYGEPVVSGVYICTLRADGVAVKSVKVIKLEQ